MKTHLPLLLRSILLAAMIQNSLAVLSWNSGNWNASDESWLDNGTPAAFADGEAVEFTASAESRNVNITELVQPASIIVSASGYDFSGSGSIGGSTSLNLQGNAGLTVQNSNSFTGGTQIAAGATLQLTNYHAAGSVNESERALGSISGAGRLELNWATPGTTSSIYGNALAEFIGELFVLQGNVGLGRLSSHGGAGAQAALAASQVNISRNGTFILSLGGGRSSLVTGNQFTPAVQTMSGAVLGNRDGHVNWSGDVSLNVQDLYTSPGVYDSTGRTELYLHFGKTVVWDSAVSGEGILEITAGVSDAGIDHRLVLTNDTNTFNGTYRVAASHKTTLALASPLAAQAAGIELGSATSRLLLMSTSAQVKSLDGSAGVVLAEGSNACILSIGGGDFRGNIRDAEGTAPAGLSLGITKTGSGTLNLVGSNCSYTGATSVQGGLLSFSGSVSLGDIAVATGAQLQTEGDMTLRSGATLQLAQNSATAGGSLILPGQVYGVNVVGYETLPAGHYDVLNWNVDSSVTSTRFTPRGMNATAVNYYAMQVQGNALQLVVGEMSELQWLWSGGSAVWSDDSAAEWQHAGGGTPAGQAVYFGPADAGTISIGRVTPASIQVLGGEYTFVAGAAQGEGIVTHGSLSISGTDTVVNMNLDNAAFSGDVLLEKGILELGTAQALGTGSLYFNGGLLRYGAGVSVDVSAQIQAASQGVVRVDTNGNDISWESSAGVMKALQQGVEKQGQGRLELAWAGNGAVYAAPLHIQQGVLHLNKTSGDATLAGLFSGPGELVLSNGAGQILVSGNNSTYEGVLQLAGDGSSNAGLIRFSTVASLGGSATQVQLAGQRFSFDTPGICAVQLEVLAGTTTYMDGYSNAAYGFSGTVTGSGTLQLKPTSAMSMSGDISQFTGTLVHPGTSAVTWRLGGEGVSGAGLVQATLSSSGNRVVYAFQYSSPTQFSGTVTGAAKLRQMGAGTLTLTGANSTSGGLEIDPGCEVVLGTAASAAAWGGMAQLGGGRFRLVNGVLSSPLATVEGSLVAEVAAGCSVDMGGTAAAMLQSICIDTGGQLTGIAGDINVGQETASLELHFSAGNVGRSAVPSAGKQTMLVQENGALVIYDSMSVTLDNEAIKTIIQGRRQAVYLHVTNAAIQLQPGVTAASLFANSATTPEALGLTVLGVENGNIVLEGAVTDVYMVTENGDAPTVTSYTKLQDYLATYVDAGYTLSLQLPGDDTQEAWVNNLLGAGDFSVTNTEESGGVVRVLLNNAVLGGVDSSLTPEQEEEINSANTFLGGDVTAGNAVQLVKTGSGTLSIGGRLTAPWLEIDEGILRLTGQGSVVQRLAGNATLELDSGSSLEIAADSLAFTGTVSGQGSLVLNGALPGRGSVGVLSGSGSLQAAGQTFSVGNLQNATFSGSLTGDGSGVLAVAAGGGRFTLNQVQGTTAWHVQNSGSMTLQQQGASANAALTLGGLNLQSGSATSLVWNSDWNNEVLNLAELVVADGAAVTLKSTGTQPVQLRADGTLVLGQVQSADLGSDARAEVTLDGAAAFRGIDSAWLSADNGYLLLNTLVNNQNRYAEAASSPNARAGAGMFWNLPAQVLADSPDLTNLVNGIDALLNSGDTAATADVMAAAAGAGAAVLGSVVAGDMERQLKSIRNRTIEMGLAAGFVYSNLPRFNAWVNAEGDHRKLQADGTDTGYNLSSWGGTVGFDVDFSPSLTAGLAFTAMYGDLDGRGADNASGSVDAYYLTVFGKYTHRRWKHTLVGAFGWSDIDLKRHVYYGTGAYHTKGQTDGASIGLLYELGYEIPLRTLTPVLMQPVFNISYRHAGIDSFREHGSDAALRFGSQDMDVVTFGLGLHVHTTALENLYNRSCPVHSRFLVKVDAGDIRSHTTASLLAVPERSGRVRSAEAHRLGLEMGIGITIPIGEESGALFLDCSYECRFDESEVNGAVGYRLSF